MLGSVNSVGLLLGTATLRVCYLLHGVLDDAEAVVERVEGAEHDDQLVEHIVQTDLAQHHARQHVPCEIRF